MNLFNWLGVQDIILLAFSHIILSNEDWYKVIWGDKISGEWELGRLSKSSIELYKPIESLKLQPEVYRTLVELVWSKKLSDFLKKDSK